MLPDHDRSTLLLAPAIADKRPTLRQDAVVLADGPPILFAA